MKDKNNIFKYATKELSQDAFLCWSINWLNESEEHPLYQYGKDILDLFLGDDKQEEYYDVELRCQYEKIDVLVMFKDSLGKQHALIIEDKTNTSEHDNQIDNYRKKLDVKFKNEEGLKEYSIHLAYVKTGIMYDDDLRMIDKGATVIDLEKLLEKVVDYGNRDVSEILSDFNAHISGIKKHRDDIKEKIDNCEYEDTFNDPYGQFCFLDKLFNNRSKGIKIGTWHVEYKENDTVYTDYIYSGTNRGGAPWTEYVFWRDKYSVNYRNLNVNEYHSLFWRVDRKWDKDKNKHRSYIALRHYDGQAHSNKKYLDERKKFVYRKLRALADKISAEHPERFAKIGVRENYKESDLLFIYIDQIQEMTLEEIGEFLNDITDRFIKECDNLYDGMEEALKDYK